MSQTAIEPTDGRDSQGRFTKGNQVARKHGAYSYWIAKRLPQVRGIRRIQKSIDRLRKEIEANIEMTPQRQIILDGIVRQYGFCLLYELHIKRMGLFDAEEGRRGKLDFQPGMRQYNSMLNSIRNGLLLLGLDGQTQQRVLTPMEIIQKEGEQNGQRNQND